MRQRRTLFLLIILILNVNPGMADQITTASEESVVARVNGRPIYARQVTPRTDAALAKLARYGASVSVASRQRIQREELDKLLDFELLTQAGEALCANSAVEKESVLSLQQVQTPSPTHDSTPQTAHNKECVEKYLDQQGLGKLRIPDAEIKKYYEHNRVSFKQGETIKVSHILIKLPRNPSSEEVSAAAAKAAAIRQELLQKDNFPDMARQHSDCATAPVGGDLGYINRGYMPAAFDTVAFTLPLADISNPVRTRHGFHLIKVTDKTSEKIRSLDEVKELIEKLLIRNAREKKMAEITDELRRKATIEINLK